MAKKNWTSRIVLIMTIIVAIIISILFFGKQGGSEYELSTDASLDLLQKEEAFISMDDAYMLLSDEASDAAFVDLRSSDLFGMGHLERAVNIPLHQLLDDASQRRLQDSATTHVLYSENMSDGVGAWALLRQMGISNIKVLQGSYTDYVEGSPSKLIEAPLYDYQSAFEKALADEKSKIMPVIKEVPPQKVVAAPKKKKKAEEEGC